jgi:hypothetical protein
MRRTRRTDDEVGGAPESFVARQTRETPRGARQRAHLAQTAAPKKMEHDLVGEEVERVGGAVPVHAIPRRLGVIVLCGPTIMTAVLIGEASLVREVRFVDRALCLSLWMRRRCRHALFPFRDPLSFVLFAAVTTAMASKKKRERPKK